MIIPDDGRAICSAVLSFCDGIGSLQKRPICAKHFICSKLFSERKPGEWGICSVAIKILPEGFAAARGQAR